MATINGTNGNDIRVGTDGNDTISGLGLVDLLEGLGGNDTIDGGSEDDLVIGGDGNDTLIGGTGNDDLVGSAGDDTVNGGGGIDFISGGEGDDTLNGDGENDFISGGEGDDIITGGTGSNVLAGGLGNDTITSAGGDQIQFDSPNDGVDTIEGFNPSRTIRVVQEGFNAGLTKSSLDLQPGRLVLGTTATDANQRFIFDGGTGALYFDPDGNGEAEQVQLATLTGVTTITPKEIFVI